MTLADLERFVTGPVIYKSSRPMYDLPRQHASCGVKRKPDDSVADDDSQGSEDKNLLQLTITKIFTPPVKRIEPPLRKCMFLRKMMKRLQRGSHGQTPSKKLNLGLSPTDADMISESTALHNLHLAASSPTTKLTSPVPILNSHATDISPCIGKEAELFIPAVQSTTATHPTTASSFIAQDTIKTDSNFNNCTFNYSVSYAKDLQSIMRMGTDSSMVASMDMCSDSNVIDAPTEMVDNTMIPSFENMDFHSLVQCSIDQFGSNDGLPGKGHNADELDNIMQVLVSM